jgi:hypothetical protein
MASGVRRKGLGWSMFFAALAFLVSNLGTTLINWLTTIFVSPVQTALISTTIGLLVVFIGVLIDHAKSGEEPEQSPPPVVYRPGYPPYRPAQPKPIRRTSWAMALVLILVLCGGGGFALTVGTQWAFGKALCFLDPVRKGGGEQRLAQPVSETAGALTLDVLAVDVSECGIAVQLHAANGGKDSLSLPVFGNSHLTIPGQTSLGGDPMTSKWDGTVPPGGELQGYVVFRGDIPPETTDVTFSFSTIFGSLGGPSSISVDIKLNRGAVTGS